MAWKRLSIRQCRESVHLANDLYETEKRLRELKKSRGVAAISAEVLFTLYPSTDANDCDLVRVTVGASDEYAHSTRPDRRPRAAAAGGVVSASLLSRRRCVSGRLAPVTGASGSPHPSLRRCVGADAQRERAP